MNVGDGPGRQWPTVTAAMLRQIAVHLGDDRRPQGLEPESADLRVDVVLDVMAVSGESLGLDGCCVGF
jgi:hypothetical protein